MERVAVEQWVRDYERLWRTEGTIGLSALFADDVSYRMSPVEPPRVGLEALAVLWDEERDGHEEPFDFSFDVIAVEGDRAVTVADVEYHESGTKFRDLWVLRFTDDGRCVEFEEWYWTK